MTQHLIPQPKELSLLNSQFKVDSGTLILLSADAGEAALLAARQLQAELRRCRPIGAPGDEDVSIVKCFAPPRDGNVILLASSPEQARALGVAAAETGATESVRSQAYTLAIAPSRIALYADAPQGFYYGVQTLRQLVRQSGWTLPTVEIRDWPVLRYRGLMVDVSRGKVPTLATLRHVVEELSHYKLNVLQLYTEHTFEFPRHPLIGSRCGSLSSQDIAELDIFCRQHQVELMPNLQSFGHARNTLEIPEYRHLAETEDLWTLSPVFEETYALLDELFGDMLPAFTSTGLNVSCDETWDLGQGASKELAEQIGVGRVYLNHILRARELAARYGCTIQIWGDIRLHHPELIRELPDDVVLLDWHYGPEPEYPTTKVFGQAGRRFWVCPGTGSWNSIFPRLYGSNVNIRNLVRDSVSAGAEGVLNTDWGDHGHYQALGVSWYGYVFGADQGWIGGAQSDEEFDAAFGPLFFGPEHEQVMSAMHQLARTNDLPGIHHPNRSHTALALFDEPLTGVTVDGENALPPATLAQMQTLADNAAATCDALAPGHPRALTLREMASAARLTAYAARKVALGQEIRRALRDGEVDPERMYCYIRALKALDVALETLRAEFESLWLARARRSEIHVALGYFSGLRVRYQAAVEWLGTQHELLLQGRTVDSELDTYDTAGYRTLWQTWRRPG